MISYNAAKQDSKYSKQQANVDNNNVLKKCKVTNQMNFSPYDEQIKNTMVSLKEIKEPIQTLLTVKTMDEDDQNLKDQQ